MTESSNPPQPAPDPTKSKAANFLQYAVGIAAIAFLAYKFPGYIKGTAFFLITLGVLVFVHEWGHYQFARWAGMKVNRFGIGFPPWIFTVRRNEIDYSIGALPIGGMVDIAGLGSEEEMVGATHTGEIPENSRDTNRPHGQKQFQDASLGWRFLALFAGPLMNFVFAIGLAIVVFCLIGTKDPKTIFVNRVDAVRAGMPAEKAGLQEGDVILGVNSLRSDDNVKISKAIRAEGKAPVSVLLKRDGQTLTKTITPILEEMPKLEGEGTEKVPIIGIEFGIDYSRVVYQRIGFIEASQKTWKATTNMIGQLTSVVGRAFTFRLTKEERREIGGPVKIAQIVNRVSEKGDWEDQALLAVALSMNLGFMNLLPFPALDGGRILFLGYELVMRKPFDPRKEGLVHMAGMVLLLAFMLLITFRDVMGLRG